MLSNPHIIQLWEIKIMDIVMQKKFKNSTNFSPVNFTI